MCALCLYFSVEIHKKLTQTSNMAKRYFIFQILLKISIIKTILVMSNFINSFSLWRFSLPTEYTVLYDNWTFIFFPLISTRYLFNTVFSQVTSRAFERCLYSSSIGRGILSKCLHVLFLIFWIRECLLRHFLFLVICSWWAMGNTSILLQGANQGARIYTQTKSNKQLRFLKRII